MKQRILLTLNILLLISFSQAQTYTQKKTIISVQKNKNNMERLTKMPLDCLMEKNGKIYILADWKERKKLETGGIPYVNEHTMITQGGINGKFHSYPELERDLISLAETFPHISSLHDIGDSVEGRNIYALKISDNPYAAESEAAVLILGCHHAREWISVEVPYLLGKHLLQNYDSDAQVKNLIDSCEIWIIPLVNPDGLEYSIHFYRYWRKNRKNNRDGTFGVDLNRNYGYKWGHDNSGSSPDSASNVYRGEAPFSEPESQAIRDLFAQRRFQALVTYHNYSQVILYPWGYTDEPSPKEELLFEMAKTMSIRMESVNGRYYGPGRAGASLYLTNGDTTDWSFGIYGIPSFTIELPPDSSLTGQFFNPEADILSIFNENLPAMLYLIEWAINNSNRQHHSSLERARSREFLLEQESVVKK